MNVVQQPKICFLCLPSSLVCRRICSLPAPSLLLLPVYASLLPMHICTFSNVQRTFSNVQYNDINDTHSVICVLARSHCVHVASYCVHIASHSLCPVSLPSSNSRVFVVVLRRRPIQPKMTVNWIMDKLSIEIPILYKLCCFRSLSICTFFAQQHFNSINLHSKRMF